MDPGIRLQQTMMPRADASRSHGNQTNVLRRCVTEDYGMVQTALFLSAIIEAECLHDCIYAWIHTLENNQQTAQFRTQSITCMIEVLMCFSSRLRKHASPCLTSTII